MVKIMFHPFLRRFIMKNTLRALTLLAMFTLATINVFGMEYECDSCNNDIVMVGDDFCDDGSCDDEGEMTIQIE
jgi:hypothetical protein